MTDVPQIRNGKMLDEELRVDHFISLPADTPFGNLCLKYTQIVLRIDHVNRLVRRAFESYTTLPAISGAVSSKDICDHWFACEEAVYWLKKTADELIGLIHVLEYRGDNGRYPDRVHPDCIGKLLKRKQEGKPICRALDSHDELLTTLNELANAFKHSFINSDITVVGRDEPCVFALPLKKNKLNGSPRLYGVSLRKLVVQFDAFFVEATDVLRKCPIPHHSPA
jgi:hypothetical protein